MAETTLDPHPKEDHLTELNPQALIMRGAHKALVGYGERCGQETVAVYDYDLLIKHFQTEGMSEEEAAEWVSFNVVGAWCGPNTPIVLTRFDEEDLQEVDNATIPPS